MRCVAALSLFLFATPALAATDPCSTLVGEWSWFIGGKVAFSSRGTARWMPAQANVQPATAQWRCSNGVYTVTWQNGFVDTLRVSPDGRNVSGTSSTGAAVSGWRGTQGFSPPQQTQTTPPAPQTQTQSQNYPKGQWIQRTDMPPQKGPNRFEGWDKLIEKNNGR